MPYLWTPIANALNAYRSRLLVDPQAVYEHTWRLIHIHEAIIVTLGSASATQIIAHFSNQKLEQIGNPEDADIDINIKNADKTDVETAIQKIKITLTGLNPEARDQEPKRGCFSGSIFEWISLLKQVTNLASKLNETDFKFIYAVKKYLEYEKGSSNTSDKNTSDNDSKIAFIEDWARIAQVPPQYKNTPVTRLDRFQAINELRNKLAHVPISGTTLHQLHINLKKEIAGLFSDEESGIVNILKDDDGTKDLILGKKFPQAICGDILYKGIYVAGRDFGKLSEAEKPESKTKPESKNDIIYFRWTKDNKRSDSVRWPASPFVYIDNELKVSILFHVKNLSYTIDDSITGEYHRFAAEVEPVKKWNIEPEDINVLLPEKVPTSSDECVDTSHTDNKSENLEQIDGNRLRTMAEEAFKSQSYKDAVSYYETMAARNLRNYTDVAKSRHGAALWRIANNLTGEGDTDEKNQKFEQAIKLLDEASQHQVDTYKAEANYQKSKALWHFAKLTDDSKKKDERIEEAKDAIETALGLELEQRYIGWYEFLLEQTENIDNQPEADDPGIDGIDNDANNDSNE